MTLFAQNLRYPGVGVEKTKNFDKLLDYLNKIEFWTPNTIISTDGKQIKTTNKLAIILVNTRQGGLIVDSQTDPNIALTSFGYREDNGRVYLFLYFNKDECLKTGCGADKIINQELILALYLITHNSSKYGDYIQVINTAKSLAENYQDVYLKINNKRTLNFGFNVYAADCATWFCGEQHETGCGPGGFSESGAECSYDCPPGYCVKDKQCFCGGGGGTPTPTPGNEGCGDGTCDAGEIAIIVRRIAARARPLPA